MMRRLSTVVAVISVGLAIAICGHALAQLSADRAVPSLINLDKIQFEIVDTMFVTSLEGQSGSRFDQSDDADKYRGVVLTLRIKKPAGESLRVNAFDLALHYYHGDGTDVAKPYGLSSFSTSNEVDRPMTLKKHGRISSRTGTVTTRSNVVYLDVFFQYMEPDTSDVYLLVAQPVASFHTDGWK